MDFGDFEVPYMQFCTTINEGIKNEIYLEPQESEIVTQVLPTKRQVNLGNVPHSGPIDYFKKTIYIPMLDNILVDLNDRFSEQLDSFLEIGFLISH
jgi:hypothetical protein